MLINQSLKLRSGNSSLKINQIGSIWKNLIQIMNFRSISQQRNSTKPILEMWKDISNCILVVNFNKGYIGVYAIVEAI